MKNTFKRFAGLLVGFATLLPSVATAQSGDQILDGIGETELIARYTFKKDARDWSRNNLHASLMGNDCQFVADSLFGNVLSLNGTTETYVSIPGEAVYGEESLTLTTWINLSANTGCLFDFGKNGKTHASALPNGSLQLQWWTENKKITVSAPALPLNKWVHLAFVLNIPAKSLSIFVDGVLAGETTKVDIELKQLFDQRSGKNNKLYIGKSLLGDKGLLKAKLYDLRLYRVPLTDKQIAGIHENALKKDEPVVRRRRREPDQNLPVFGSSTPQLYNAYLLQVADVQVETRVGDLPRLPHYLKGVYSDSKPGPAVRVIWPSPTDNSQTLKEGSYTVTGKIPGSNLQPKATVVVKSGAEPATPNRTLEKFRLDQVSLDMDSHHDSTKFVENREKFLSVLATTNPDNFLYMFRNAFGQKQPTGAEALGVWDSQETKLRGHATGHYLSALAQAYAGTGYNPALHDVFEQKMAYMVDVLYDLSKRSGQPQTEGGPCVSDPQAVPPGPGKTGYDSDLSDTGIRTDYWNWGKGFISAYPPDQFIMLEKGANYGGDNSRIWAPYYTLHKILAGLMDIYEISGNQKALDIVKGMGDWVYARLSPIPTETLVSMWNRYIAGEFGGMNEAMARLYRLTKEPRYLEVAKRFDNIRVFYGNADHVHGLAKNVDLFRGLHANQHIPQIIGALEMYRDSKAPDYYRIADNFWDMATNDYMYSIGGVAGARNPNNGECFTAQPSTLYENGFGPGGQNETCATYNMLKLSGDLFLFHQDAALMDYYERGLYNHILASVDEHTPANTYHVPVRPGSFKQFGNPDMSGFTCCNGTALESSTKLQNSIYFKGSDNKSLYVNLYIPSTLNWSERKVTVTQTTAYPKEDHTMLTIHGKGKFDLKVRVPHWATKGFFVTINGKSASVEAVPGSYVTLSRNWKNGDVVELRMPFTFYLEPIMDQQNIASLFWGPVLLAAQEPEPRTDWRVVELNADDLGKTITGDPAKLEFQIDGVTFKPFYDTYGRHSVYLDVRLR